MANRSFVSEPEYDRPVPGELNSAFLNDEFFGMQEAANFLRLSLSSMQKISAKRFIPVYKPSRGKVYFRKSDLLAYLEAGAVSVINQNLNPAIYGNDKNSVD